MNFRRSSSGLSNLHLFAAVDVIVFTEGGPATIPIEQLAFSDVEVISYDGRFWQELLRRVKPNLNCQTRAVGSKEILREIVAEIESGHVSNVLVAMDRDYDGHFGALCSTPCALYTRGYSWENDIFDAEVIADSFYEISLVSRTNINVDNEINVVLATAVRDLRWWVYADALLCAAGSSLFRRDRPASVIPYPPDRLTCSA